MGSTHKRIAIIAAAIAVVALLLTLVFRIFFAPDRRASKEEVESGTGSLGESSDLQGGTQAPGIGGERGATGPRILIQPIERPRVTDEERLLHTLAIAARDFAERYGSYSTEGDFANLETLLPIMTGALLRETKALIAKNSVSSASVPFLGITTKALSEKPIGPVAAGAAATVAVLTQRTQETDDHTTIRYETLTLTLLEENGVWKVSGATWSRE